MHARSSDSRSFVKHLPCPACGSSDANALYRDGHTHCFNAQCWTTVHADGSASRAPEDLGGDLIQSHPCALPGRGLRQTTLEHFGYGEGRARNPKTKQWEKCQVAPYYKDGQLVGQKLRFRNKVFITTGDIKSADLYGMHLWKPGPKRTVVVVEGEHDAHAMSQVQDNKWAVVSLKQGAGSIKDLLKHIDWLDQFGRIVLMFDMDEPGQEAAKQAAALLPPGKVFIGSLPEKDPNAMLLSDDPRGLIQAMWDAKEWRPDGLVWGETAWDLYANREEAVSIPYSHPGLDGRAEGHRDSEIITVCAGTMVGKSAWMREEIAHLADQGIRTGVIALEEPVRRQIQGLCSIALEKPLHLRQCADISDAEVHDVFVKRFPEVVFDNHKGTLGSGKLLQKMRYMARGLGCRRIVLDHLTILMAGSDGESERKEIDKFLHELVSLTEETGVGVFLVCHLKRPKDGKGFERGRPIALADLRGSSMIEALSNDVIGLERDIEDESGITKIHLLKCRWTGNPGYAGNLQWYPDRCRLLPTDVEQFEIDNEPGDFDG